MSDDGVANPFDDGSLSDDEAASDGESLGNRESAGNDEERRFGASVPTRSDVVETDESTDHGDGDPLRDGFGKGDRDARSDPTDAPLGELASSVRDRRDRDDDALDDVFEERDVTEIDADAVWERIETDDPTLHETDEASVQETDGPVERVVEKASFCERCPFFSEPPVVSCSHEGTSIVELVDVDHFRVVDCPKVQEAERLEEL